MASMCEDIKTLECAFSSAEAVVREDPELSSKENLISKKYMERLFEIKNNMVN